MFFSGLFTSDKCCNTKVSLTLFAVIHAQPQSTETNRSYSEIGCAGLLAICCQYLATPMLCETTALLPEEKDWRRAIFVLCSKYFCNVEVRCFHRSHAALMIFTISTPDDSFLASFNMQRRDQRFSCNGHTQVGGYLNVHIQLWQECSPCEAQDGHCGNHLQDLNKSLKGKVEPRISRSCLVCLQVERLGQEAQQQHAAVMVARA